ncbi:hypothetical protein CEXT_806321 [Caerostris extrusa]|uniref:Uncharacterized protein n=1 Tax=Caerostris extrusa TaxID=172846 RepID=A0AAV4VYI0_CAEEX|nr:hypothetical protein CEXT_806321 [Caerostris extrusa]
MCCLINRTRGTAQISRRPGLTAAVPGGDAGVLLHKNKTTITAKKNIKEREEKEHTPSRTLTRLPRKPRPLAAACCLQTILQRSFCCFLYPFGVSRKGTNNQDVSIYYYFCGRVDASTL